MSDVICSGKHYWEIKFHRTSMGATGSLGACYYVGVVVDDGSIDYDQSLGESATNWAKAWVIHDNNAGSGEVKHNGSSKPYKFSYSNNDRVGVLVDRDAKTISFFKNGKYGGIAFKKLPDSAVMYPAITIYNSDCSAEILTGMPIPTIKPGKGKGAAAAAADSDSSSESESEKKTAGDDDEDGEASEATSGSSEDES